MTAASLHLHAKRHSGLRKARAWPFLVPIVVWILVMFGYPIYDTIRMAFSYVNGTNFTTGGWKWAGFQNFRTLPYLQGWTPMLRNTALFIAGSVIPQLIIGGLLAVTLRENSRPRRWARSLVLLPWLFPAVATATTFLWMFESPGALRLDLQELRPLGALLPPDFERRPHRRDPGEHLDRDPVQLPRRPERAADHPPRSPRSGGDRGLSWWKELTRVTIPLLRETILTVLMLGIAGTMNVFAFVWILTMGGPADATMLPGPLAYTQAFVQFNYGQGAAIILGVVAVLLCVAAMFLIATRPRSGREGRTKRSGPGRRQGRRTRDRPASHWPRSRQAGPAETSRWYVASPSVLTQVASPSSHPDRPCGADHHYVLPVVPDLLVGAGVPQHQPRALPYAAVLFPTSPDTPGVHRRLAPHAR